MKIYKLEDGDTYSNLWFETKAEAMKAYRNSGKLGNTIYLSVLKIGTKKCDLIDLLNLEARNGDCEGDEPDFCADAMDKGSTCFTSLTVLESKN